MPLFDPSNSRNSNRKMKLEYSLVVNRFPPPSAGQTSSPFSTTYPDPFCPTICQPSRFLPLNKGANPGLTADMTTPAASKTIPDLIITKSLPLPVLMLRCQCSERRVEPG